MSDQLPRVYVDPLMTCLMSRAWRWPMSSHLFADTEQALHAFAKRIGLRRHWFQSGRFPHYDVNEAMRVRAVAAGAVELDRRQAVAVWRAKGWTFRQQTKGGQS